MTIRKSSRSSDTASARRGRAWRVARRAVPALMSRAWPGDTASSVLRVCATFSVRRGRERTRGALHPPTDGRIRPYCWWSSDRRLAATCLAEPQATASDDRAYCDSALNAVITEAGLLVLPVRIELTTSPLPRGCSTTELRQHRVSSAPAVGDGFPNGSNRRGDACHKAGTGASDAPSRGAETFIGAPRPRILAA
jgi:hypothetical protein